MYRKTAKSTHYLPRKGSYSTVPHRNGRVDVLPPEAEEPLYDVANQIEDGRSRIEILTEQKQSLTEELRLLDGVHGLQLRHSRDIGESRKAIRLRADISAINETLKNTRKHIGQLVALTGSSKQTTFESAFVQIAKVELAVDTFEKISRKAVAITRRIRALK